ncbi:FMN-binding protein [Alkaliphilus transvaalensis]|uniref:FMN-binding protein n=1 Tax=Alkaliphilus transvaalensis TaxID=114628 RepID=UPI00047E6614|nr:FMN-binding protein [Alkaliphilus transvaalensis]
MKKFNYNSILFMIVISVVFTGSLALINEATKDAVALNDELREHKSLLYVADIPFNNKTAVEVSNIFQNNVKKVNFNGLVYYEGYQEDVLVSYIFPIEGDAVWGHLKGFISLSTDLTEILGVDFLSHSETPGLGGRIDELSYKEQFRGIEIDPNREDGNYIIYRPNPDGQVDSISGATGTSNAVRRILNENLQAIIKGMEGKI